MRITGGALRSRILRAPRGLATRPTTDRAREALFSMLASASLIDGARVLDLYAGTGSLGLEALSRGAAYATFVESARAALSALRTNVADLGVVERTTVMAGHVESVAARLARDGPYDVVFADPPWALIDRGDAPRALGEVVARGALARGGMLVLEHAARSSPPDLVGLELREGRRFGDTAIALYVATAGTPSLRLPEER
jgi:16S rRNA (guanine966-N2)-methyltransferase